MSQQDRFLGAEGAEGAADTVAPSAADTAAFEAFQAAPPPPPTRGRAGFLSGIVTRLRGSASAPEWADAGAGFASGLASMASAAAASLDSPGLSRVWVVVMALLGFAVLGLLVWYLYRRFTTSQLSTFVALSGSPVTGAPVTPLSVADASFPTLSNGREWSLSTWIYLSGVDPTDGFKRILYRGAVDRYDGASPVFYMDRVANSLTVKVATNGAAAGPYTTLDAVDADDCGFRRLSLGYVPLQRWVNLTLVVEDSVLTLCQDGDVVAVANTQYSPRGTTCSAASAVAVPSAGNLYIGGGGLNNEAGINGLIGQTVFANYALTLDKVRTIYSAGPIRSSLLGYIGLPDYGLQWPIVRLDAPATSGA
jgi:hypothetical protein